MLKDKKPLRLLALQAAIPRLNQLEVKSNAPLAAGYLFSYLKFHLKEQAPQMQIVPRTLSDLASASAIIDFIKSSAPDVLLVTLYLWNLKKSLQIVREVKMALPELLVIYGGPEVNAGNELLLNSGEFVLGVSGEGEIPLFKAADRHSS